MSADSALGVLAPRGPRRDTPNFDRLAPLYRWMEWFSFGPFLWWCRCAFLNDLRRCRRALVIGDGDGRFTQRLLQTNSQVRVNAVDASPAMLHVLLRRAGDHAQRVQTVCRDARESLPAPPACFDLIVTHFFLDCLPTEEVRLLALRVRAATRPKALWVVSEFAIPDGLLGSLVGRPLVSSLYWAFGRLTGLRQRRLPDHRNALRDAGFGLVQRKEWLGGLLVSEMWTASGLLQEC